MLAVVTLLVADVLPETLLDMDEDEDDADELLPEAALVEEEDDEVIAVTVFEDEDSEMLAVVLLSEDEVAPLIGPIAAEETDVDALVRIELLFEETATEEVGFQSSQTLSPPEDVVKLVSPSGSGHHAFPSLSPPRGEAVGTGILRELSAELVTGGTSQTKTFVTNISKSKVVGPWKDLVTYAFHG